MEWQTAASLSAALRRRCGAFLDATVQPPCQREDSTPRRARMGYEYSLCRDFTSSRDSNVKLICSRFSWLFVAPLQWLFRSGFSSAVASAVAFPQWLSAVTNDNWTTSNQGRAIISLTTEYTAAQGSQINRLILGGTQCQTSIKFHSSYKLIMVSSSNWSKE